MALVECCAVPLAMSMGKGARKGMTTVNAARFIGLWKCTSALNGAASDAFFH